MRRHAPERDRWAPLPVEALTDHLGGTAARWWLSGGVALEVFAATRWRDHGDIDVSVARCDWPEFCAVAGKGLSLCPVRGGWIDEHGQWSVGDTDSMWARTGPEAPWCLQINVETVVGDHWVYRRDDRVRLPLSEATWWTGALRCVDPAVQLLWKSSRPRPEDEEDLRIVLPRLTQRRRTWLRQSVALAHPGSPWMAVLREPGNS